MAETATEIESEEEESIQRSVNFDCKAKIASFDYFPEDKNGLNPENGLLSQISTDSEQESIKFSLNGFWKCLIRYGKLLRSIIARLLFFTHAVVCIVVAVHVINQSYIYILIAPASLLIAEAYLTLRVRENVEWKWFTPCIAIFQLCTVPSIWLLEYKHLDMRRHPTLFLPPTTHSSIAGSVLGITSNYLESTTSATMSSTTGDLRELINSTISTYLHHSSVTSQVAGNSTAMPFASDVTDTESWQTRNAMLSLVESIAANITNSSDRLSISNHTTDLFSLLSSGLLNVNLSEIIVPQSSRAFVHPSENIGCQLASVGNLTVMIEQCCLYSSCVPVLEQVLLFSMIIGRWLLPRSEHLTRDQKAQLLLVNIAIAADILELKELLKEDQVMNNELLITVILFVWSCSLVQFAIVGTAMAKKSCRGCSCFESELWSLVTLLFLDDAPFLILRLVCIIYYKVKSYNSYFFVSKNFLVLALDVNRIVALHIEKKKQKKEQAQWTELQRLSSHRESVSRIRR